MDPVDPGVGIPTKTDEDWFMAAVKDIYGVSSHLMDIDLEKKTITLRDEYTITEIAELKRILWCRRCGESFNSGVHARGTFVRTMVCFKHDHTSTLVSWGGMWDK